MTDLDEFSVTRLSAIHMGLRGVAAAFCCIASVVLCVGGAVAETDVKAGSKSRSVVTGPATAGVFRSTGANGEVEFNNFGNGEPVALEVVPPALGAELERSSARVQEMLDVAQVLATDRQARERIRAAKLRTARQARVAAAREEARLADWVAATQPRYYPAFAPRLGAGYGRGYRPRYGPDWRPRSGPYREEYRYPEQPAAPVEAPVRRQPF